MNNIYQCDRDSGIKLSNGNPDLVKYKCANTRKCYWQSVDCLKGHGSCSKGCVDYISTARIRRFARGNKK